jgi:DNA-binding NarL/FixJ family response regulator
MQVIDILIADNQMLTHEGIAAVLAPLKDIHVLGSVTSSALLDQMIRESEPQLVILDPDFDSAFNLGAIKEINARFNFTNVLVLSNNTQRNTILEVIEGGARSYISKDCRKDEFVTAIYASARGEAYFCEKVSKILFGDQVIRTEGAETPLLSSRETEIVHLIARGLTNKDIADKLYLSVHTIKTHRKNIIKKLGFTFKNAAELVLLIGYLNDLFI